MGFPIKSDCRGNNFKLVIINGYTETFIEKVVKHCDSKILLNITRNITINIYSNETPKKLFLLFPFPHFKNFHNFFYYRKCLNRTNKRTYYVQANTKLTFQKRSPASCDTSKMQIFAIATIGQQIFHGFTRGFALTHKIQVFPSYRNQLIDFHSKLIDWLLCEGNTGIYWVTAYCWWSFKDNICSFKINDMWKCYYPDCTNYRKISMYQYLNGLFGISSLKYKLLEVFVRLSLFSCKS